MSVPVVEFPSRQAAMRKLIGLLDDAERRAPGLKELVEIRAVASLLVDEMGQLAEKAGEMLRAAGYEPKERVVPKSDSASQTTEHVR